MQKSSHRLIVVLGMHRSGSSALTKGLETMGVELGDDLMPPNSYNEKGYFEDIEINRLNIEVMELLGYRWNSLSVFTDSTFKVEALSQLREKATDLLTSKFQNKNILGIKDPRMCRLLPFWKPVFSEMGLHVHYVIMLRHLESIADSLLRRDSFPRVKSIQLWALHMLSAFNETAGYPRAVVDYDRLIETPDAEIRKLACNLELENALNESTLDHFCSQFIDQSLNHHTKPDVEARNFTPNFIKQFQSAMTQLSSGTLSTNSEEFENCLKETECALKERSDLLGYIDTLDNIIIRFRRAQDSDYQLSKN